VLLYFGYFCCCNFWSSPFYSRHNAQFFFLELKRFNALMIFCGIFLVISSGKMSSNDSPPRVRQRVEESVADRRLCMEKRQVLSQRNLLCADLRDPVLLPIGKMI
jgi:hypothetical protein